MEGPASVIAGYEDWPAFVRAAPVRSEGGAGAARLAGLLGVPALPAAAPEPEVTAEKVVDGVRVRRLRWQLPFGPPTTGYLAAPEEHGGNLPGVLWLHCHAGNKWLGGERLVDLGDGTLPEVRRLQRDLYDGRPVVNDLARAGYAVLVHDTFSWGSRKFRLEPAPPRTADWLAAREALWERQNISPTPEQRYNEAAAQHENTLAKAAGLLGTSYAGMVAYDDLAALALLRAAPEVDAARLGTVGFSGGGGRALILAALAPDVRSCVIACMMTTFQGLFPAHVDRHSWLLNTPGLAAAYEWPELTALAPSGRYLVQYAADDPLFAPAAMREADRMLERLHAAVPERYTAGWHDTGHVFTSEFFAQALQHFQSSL